MKTTIIAKQNFTIKHGNQHVNIVKGDRYDVYGQVFVVGNTVVDLRNYFAMFDAVSSHEQLQPLKLQATNDIRIVSKRSGKTVTITKGQVLNVWSNVISIEGVVFDICDYMFAFTRHYTAEELNVTQEPANEPKAPAETEEPANEPKAPAETEEPANEPEAPAETEEPANEPEAPAETEEPANEVVIPEL